MAQTNYTPISLYYSTTASAVPTAANLVPGELAINTNDGKLYYEDSSGVVQVLATKSTGSIGGSNTQVQFNNSGSLGGSSSLTWDGSALTTSRLALGGTTLPSAGTATLFSRSSDNNTYLQTGSGSNFYLLDGSQNTMYGVSSTQHSWAISNSTKMILDASSSLLVGTSTAPTAGGLSRSVVSFKQLNDSGTSANIIYSSGIQLEANGNTNVLCIGYDGSSFGFNASYRTTGGYVPITFYTTGTERLRIAAGGNVGIGTSSPTNKLEVVGTIYTNNGSADNLLSINGDGAIKSGVQFKANGGGPYTTMYFDNSTNNTYYKNLAGGGHLFYNGTTQAMTLDASGNLLVGTTSNATVGNTTVKTNIVGVGTLASSGGIGVSLPNSTAGTVYVSNSVTSAGTGWLHFTGQSGNGSAITTNNVFIYGNGDIQNANNSYGAISDAKLKENIVDATPKLDKLMQVRIRNYNLKGDYEQHKQIGVVAQELITVFPTMVEETPDRDKEGNDLGTTTKSVKYSVFVPMLIKAIQEQQALIESLTTRLTALENK